MSLDDVLFTLFRHKRLVLAFCCLGVAGAAVARMLCPPLYVSEAKLMVHYVLESRGVSPGSPEAENIKQIDPGALAIIAQEVEILTSSDVIAQAVDTVGPERILARVGGGKDRYSAFGVVSSGLLVTPPRNSVITVSFKHRDPEIAKSVLSAIIQAYILKNRAVHEGIGELDESYRQQTEQMRKKLATTEEELKRLKRDANVLFLDDAKRSYQEEISKATGDLLDAQRELAEQRAILGRSAPEVRAGGATNAPDEVVPSDKLGEYGDIAGELDSLRRHERELLRSYKEAHPEVQTVHAQIEKLTAQKADLERAFPALAHLALGGVHGGTNAFGGDVGDRLARIPGLEARVSALGTILSNIEAQASQVMEVEPRIAEVERRRNEEQKSYEFLLKSLERTQNRASANSGEANGISTVENPTPPGLDDRKARKRMGAVFAGCLGLGVGLAFLIDFVLDRSLKRPLEVERHLRLPVFLTIPDTAWARKRGSRRKDGRTATGTEAGRRAGEAGREEIVQWKPDADMQAHVDGLRERLMTYFEVNNLNLKKPKLVALTGCSEGAGVSTLASGLAATLSKTGDGNVLLVDMNGEHGMAHSFYQGKPGCGLSAALEPEARADAQVQENLYLASLRDGPGQSLAKAMPTRFSHLVPKLKASDYDYIIFDMPPVSPASATPRLASYMDIVLLVLEAEKTKQHSAVRASALMRESRANVAAVLNKQRSYVPAGLSQDT